MSASRAEGPGPNSIGPSAYINQQVTSLSGVRVLFAGWDSVWVNYRLDLERFVGMQDRLAEWKFSAQSAKESCFLVPGGDCYMSARGRRNYEYVLIREGVGEVAVTLNPLFWKCPVRVRLYSEFIAACQFRLDVALPVAWEFVEDIFGVGAVEGEMLSELHLAIDVAGWFPRITDFAARRFLCDASPVIMDHDVDLDVIHSMRWSGAGKPVSCAIYNKSKEIREQSRDKEYFLDLYRSKGWAEDLGDVFRIEFRLGRDGLRQLGIDGVSAVDVAGLLRFFMGQGLEARDAWLSVRDPSVSDSNKWRWSVSSFWVAIRDQAIEVFGETGVFYRREYVHRGQVEKLVDMAGGCIASLAALVGQDRAAGAFRYAYKVWMARQGARLKNDREIIAERRRRYMLLSDETRRELDADLLARLALVGA